MEIISFFSFKGGVGRTALVSNLGALWASQGKTVVLVDMDLSAPGLTFSPLACEWLESDGTGFGFSDMLSVHYEQQRDDEQGEAFLLRPSMLLRRMKDPTANPDEPDWGGEGQLLLIDAGSPQFTKPNNSEEGQVNDIHKLDSPNLDRNTAALRTFAKGMRQDLADWRHPRDGKSIDYVLIDCRTGFAELVDLSLGFLSDRMVLISGINGQNLKGLELTLLALRRERVQVDEFPAKVAVVLSPVPTTEDDSLLAAMEQAHNAISAAMRKTQSGLPESSPLLYHLHYTPALAFDERPLTLRQPKSRYAREVSLIASWIDRRLTPPWERDAVTDDTLTSLYEKLGMGTTRVSVGISPDSEPPSASPPDAEAEKRSNPASDLPPWYWALPPDQQSPERRLRRLEKLVQVRLGTKIDAEAFANRLSWATMNAKEKQEQLDRLLKLRQEAVDNAIADLDALRSGVIQVMSGTEGEKVLETFYQAEKAWGVVANKKEATGLRRFLASPVDGESLFPNWEKWPQYWMMLARDLILELSDLARALKAIDRAAEIGDRDTIAGDLLRLIPTNRMSSSMRSHMVAKAHDLAPNSTWVRYRMLTTEAVLDRVAAGAVVELLLNEPPKSKSSCYELAYFVLSELPNLAHRVENIVKLAIDDKHETAPTQYLYGLYYKRINSFNKSEAAYRRSIELDPNSLTSWNGLANLLVDSLHRYDEAEAAYRRAIDLDPKEAALWNGLANLLADSLHRYDEAEAAYRRAIDLDPKVSAAWNGLGVLLRNLGRCAEALDCFSNGVQQRNYKEFLAMNRASLLWSMGRFDSARSDAATALELFTRSDTDLHQCNGLGLALWLDDPVMLEMVEKLRISAEAHSGDFSTVFGLFLHSLATGVDISVHYSRVVEKTCSHAIRIMIIEDLYNLSGWRPGCQQAAREAARSFYNLPAEVIARFKDVPTPKFRLDPFIPFLEGRSDGAGDPRDLPLICKAIVPSSVQG